MANDKEKLISTLQQNIKQLILLYEQEKVAVTELNKVNLQLLSQLKEKEGAYSALEVKYNTLKLAKIMVNNPLELHHAKLRVNSIVREIDKCIALLNR
jgi:ABC-type enterochelin transport system substrate-binding protein